MHFHVATILMLVSLLLAAPTANFKQRKAVNLTEVLGDAFEEVTDALGKDYIESLPSKRDPVDITETVGSALKEITGAIGKDYTKHPSGKRAPVDITETLGDAVKGITGAIGQYTKGE